MTHERLNDVLESLAKCWLNYHGAIEKTLKPLTDDELVVVAEAMRGEEDKWCRDIHVAAKAEVGWRIRLRQARAAGADVWPPRTP